MNDPILSQSITQFIESRQGIAAHERLLAAVDSTLDEAIAIQQIPAPTFAEAARAEYVRGQCAGLADLEMDAMFDVYGRLPGDDPNRPALLIAAHMDTVFEAATDLSVWQSADRVSGPGIGDNSLGVAALLAVMRLLRDQPHRADIWIVANTREEGLGDLDGIRAVIDRLRARGVRLEACLILEGMAYSQIYHSGIAVRRLKISAQAEGGHSWLHFGQPSAIHDLVRFAARVTDLKPPASPRTTFNIGLIEGGSSVNTIAAHASLTLDLRSEDPAALAALEHAVRDCRDPNTAFQIAVVGDRPAGLIARSHPLVQAARHTLEALGTVPNFQSGSTDANYPLACGIPAITIGITQGGNAHRLDEFITTDAIGMGLWQLVLLALNIADGLA